MADQMSITEIIEDVKADICNNYCKYPHIFDKESEDYDPSESDICENCPLGRL